MDGKKDQILESVILLDVLRNSASLVTLWRTAKHSVVYKTYSTGSICVKFSILFIIIITLRVFMCNAGAALKGSDSTCVQRNGWARRQIACRIAPLSGLRLTFERRKLSPPKLIWPLLNVSLAAIRCTILLHSLTPSVKKKKTMVYHHVRHVATL